jgi:simple sugar transport system ATP-binding protein
MQPILELKNVSKSFGTVMALRNLDFDVVAGEVHCLLGDNGAGKSTLIKILAGVHRITDGAYLIDGQPAAIASPRDALDRGVATVYQDLALVPLMSITRNFFMGRELKKGRGPFSRFDIARADEIVLEQLAGIGIDVRDPGQAVGTLSGGERQCLAIARAVYFGARVLILDEPTSALGVKEAATVLRFTQAARAEGVGIVFITHNAHHATLVGDLFTVLIQGRVAASFKRGEKSSAELLSLMAGGEQMEDIAGELAGLAPSAPIRHVAEAGR